MAQTADGTTRRGLSGTRSVVAAALAALVLAAACSSPDDGGAAQGALAGDDAGDTLDASATRDTTEPRADARADEDGGAGGADAAEEKDGGAGGADAASDGGAADDGGPDGGSDAGPPWSSGPGVWCGADTSGCPRSDAGVGYCCTVPEPACRSGSLVGIGCFMRVACDEANDCAGRPCCGVRTSGGSIYYACSQTSTCPLSWGGNPSAGQLCNPANANECLDGKVCKLATSGFTAGYYRCVAP